jgi:hypothetical protein
VNIQFKLIICFVLFYYKLCTAAAVCTKKRYEMNEEMLREVTERNITKWENS